MRIGFTLPQMGALAHHAAEAGRFARQAEELGADSLWVGDRLLAPVHPSVGYGGAGTSVPESFRAALDPFALLSVAAACTERALIGSNVLQAPLYPPALLARSLTTIDQLSGGRLVPGFGVGWSPEEYRAAGVPMEQRGARLEECLDVLAAWWSADPVEHLGKHSDIPASHVEVKPVQRPGPPVHLAGFRPNAMRRVARRAAGWLPVVQPGAGDFDPAAVNVPMAQVRRFAAEAGRDPSELGVILRVYPTAEATVADIADTLLRAGEETDADHAFVELMNLAHDVDQALDVAERILERARAK